MDFQLDEDQLALRDGIRSFCEGRLPNEQLAALEQGFDRELWAELAEMGVFGLRLSEDEGGVGLGAADAVVVFAELGRRLVPGPTVWTHLAAGLIPGAAEGSTVVGGLDCSHGAPGPYMIEDFESLDALLVLKPDAVEKVDPKRLSAEAIDTPLDPLTPVHRVSVLPAGERIGDTELSAKLRLEGATLAAAQMLGIAESSLELANDYAKEREQFGRPIGGFQAIKHMLADMFTRQEVARAAVYAAGATIDAPEVGSAQRAASAAKVVCGDAAMKNARASIQIHGGMGYTWEVPAHYFLKRTWVLENGFGTTDEHCEKLAELIAESL